MEGALYGIFTLVGFVSEISLANSCENPVRTHFPWSNLYIFKFSPKNDFFFALKL